MRFVDFFDPEKALASLIKLAIMLLIVVIAFQLVVCLLAQLSSAHELLAFLFLIAVSPLAYWVRELRRGRPRREARRGAERTPVLPHGHEEDQ